MLIFYDIKYFTFLQYQYFTIPNILHFYNTNTLQYQYFTIPNILYFYNTNILHYQIFYPDTFDNILQYQLPVQFSLLVSPINY